MTVLRRVLAALLVLFALAWVPLNKPVEGPTLLVLSHRHGVTLADLLSVAAVVLAVWLAWPRRARAGDPPRSTPPQAPPRVPPQASPQVPPPRQPVHPPRRPVPPPHDLGSMRTQPIWPLRR